MSTLITAFLFIFSLGVFAQEDNEVDLLINRRQAKEARLKMIAEEVKEIRYNTYVFDLDDTGREILGLMADARSRGVTVKLIIDDWEHGLAKRPAHLKALQDLGIEIKIFNPISKNPFGVNYRNHIKSLIGSDEIIVGGRNTKGDYFKEYIDIEAHVKGKEVVKAKQHYDVVFNSSRVHTPVPKYKVADLVEAKAEIEKWMNDARAKVKVPTKFKMEHHKVESLTYHADPPKMLDKKNRGINKEVVKMIDRAEETLEFMNPYVLITPEEREALKRAVNRGVKIKIITNASATTDSKLFAMAWDLRKHELVDMGIDVHESRQYVHGKTIIRDAEEVFIGSFNLDMRSHNLNLENGIIFKNKKLAEQLSTHNRRVIKAFMKKVEANFKHDKAILKKGGKCIRDGVRHLITNIVYGIL